MKHWKLIIVCACVFITISAILYALTIKNQLDKESGKDQKISKEIESEAAIIAEKIDKDGLHHAIVSASDNAYKKSDIKAAVEEGILDTTALALGIKKKEIAELTRINSLVVADRLRAYALLDSQRRLTYYYQDKFLKLAYRPGNPTDTTDRGEFDFKYNADLTITQYNKRKWFLGTKKSFIDIYSNDPRTTIKGVKHLTVEQQAPAFGLSLQGVSSFNFSTGKARAGAGLQFDLKRFSINGNYLFEPTANRWETEVQGKFDLLKF